MIDRRTKLQQSACGFGWLAFSALAANAATKPAHFTMKAKRAVFLFMEGGPSQLDTFDWKPELARAGGRWLAPAFPFQQRGQSGLWISEAFPHLAKQADELCMLNGVTTNNAGHQQAVLALHTGSENFSGHRWEHGSCTASAQRRMICRGS
jgi:hypothetical protein